MKKILLSSLITASYLISSEPVMLDTKSNVSNDESVYAIQLVSYDKSREKLAHKFFLDLDDDIRKDAVMYQNNEYIFIRYKTSSDKANLSKELAELKKGQYKDSYIVKSNYKNLLKAKENNGMLFLNAPHIDKEVVKKPKIQKSKALISKDVGYSIQLASFRKNNLNGAKVFLKRLPTTIKKDSVIYPVGNYYTIRYMISDSRNSLKKNLGMIKNSGFKDSLIIKTLVKKFQKQQNYTYSNTNIPRAIESSKKPFKMVMLDTFTYSKILINADKLKNDNKLQESIELYEKAFGHKQTNQSVNNNLYYLYGKTNNWPRANELINLVDKKDKVLYAYAIGAIEINNPRLEAELLPVLKYDISGYAKLALGVYFENNKVSKKAHDYYTSAYDTNRYDLYLAFAYARSSELNNDNDNAKFIYKMISENRENKLQDLKQQAYSRYRQLEELKQMESKD